MSVISLRKQDGVLIVTSDNPPVNALGLAVRQGLMEAIEQASRDDEIKTVVIRCEGQTFFAGADISEFTKPPVEPLLPAIVEAIEACPKPVVAAVHGTALGGGCEVAISCHYRIAVPSAVLGLPEVKLGLLPGASGTQRLPRLVGVEAALEMATKGENVSARRAREIGLIDRLANEDSLAEDAITFAKEVANIRPIPRTSEKKVAAEPGIFEAFRKANARKFRGFEAPEEIIQCIEAATRLPFDEGLAVERQTFKKLLFSSQSAAQRHIFFAQRKAARIEGLAEGIALRDIRKVGVIGAGTMGGGISMNFLSAGIPVTIVEQQAEALERGVGVIRKNYEASAAKGRLTPDQVEQAMGPLTPTLAIEDVSDCDLVIEAVFENMDVKQDVFRKLDAIAKPGAILASNTSYLSIDEIAAVTGRPGDVLGLHFFSPANAMKLLEIVRGDKTADDVLATAMAVSKKIKKVAVIAGVCHGFIGNRMLMPRQLEAEKLLIEGATPEQVDRVHVDFGMPMGPFQMVDLAGTDIGWHRDPGRIDNIRDALCAEGRLGQKKQAGFYDYDDKRNPSPSQRVAEIIETFRAKANVTARTVSDAEIIERTLYPIVNEGALILEEGIAQRASDIDVVWVFGYGWPVYRGGPMFWCDLEGAKKIVVGLEKHMDKFGPHFRLSALLKEKADSGGRFNG